MLGSGSTSVVFKKGKYAVKSYGSSFNLSKVLREVYFLTVCQHENIIRLHKVYVNKGELKLKLDYGGICLAKLRNEPNKLDRVAKVFPSILKALAFLHHNGICHRDVSPFNILCGDTTKLCDFGSSIFAKSYEKVIMNEYFNSPEKIKTEKSDIYSFAMSICYYLGNPPANEMINGTNLRELILASVACIENRPSAIDLLIMMGIEYKPNKIEINLIGDLMAPIAKDDVVMGIDHFREFRKRKYKVC